MRSKIIHLDYALGGIESVPHGTDCVKAVDAIASTTLILSHSLTIETTISLTGHT